MNHTHRCACGTELRCAADIDKCAVFPNWTCPTCEAQALDDFYSQLANTQPVTAQEPNRYES